MSLLRPSTGRSRWPRHPVIFEINTWPWLAALGDGPQSPRPFDRVPEAEWDRIAAMGVDAVWLMGVWERSPLGIEIALGDAELVASFQAVLPDLAAGDVVGSPYCIRDYEVDPRLGGRSGLAVARQALATRGVRLLLDFVPNHVAPDHPWTVEHPEYFVRGDSADLAERPEEFLSLAGHVVARGRDPYFPPWRDVAQLDTSSPALRTAMVATLLDIADQCDGVRCDMAMLPMNEVFERTWGERVGPAPPTDYWPDVIGPVRAEHPDFLFVAEAYWDMEGQLRQQGFDHCYDKGLYDRLVGQDAESIRLHLSDDVSYQEGLVRFIENHDESPAASAFERGHHEAAAIVALTQAGARLVYDGQTSGRRTHVPVFLGRRPLEEHDEELGDFYRRLLDVLRGETFRSGRWRLCDRWARSDDDAWQQLVAWCWEGADRWLIVVNLGPRFASGLVAAQWHDLGGQDWRLTDPTTGVELRRTGDDLGRGLSVGLEPWRWHIFHLRPFSPTEIVGAEEVS